MLFPGSTDDGGEGLIHLLLAVIENAVNNSVASIDGNKFPSKLEFMKE